MHFDKKTKNLLDSIKVCEDRIEALSYLSTSQNVTISSETMEKLYNEIKNEMEYLIEDYKSTVGEKFDYWLKEKKRYE